jgi:hypothetical protein
VPFGRSVITSGSESAVVSSVQIRLASCYSSPSISVNAAAGGMDDVARSVAWSLSYL